MAQMQKLTVYLPAYVLETLQQEARQEYTNAGHYVRKLLCIHVDKRSQSNNVGEDEASYTVVASTRPAQVAPTETDIVIPEMFKRQEQVRQPSTMASIYGKKE